MRSLIGLRENEIPTLDDAEVAPVMSTQPYSGPISCNKLLISGSPDLAPLPWACINFICFLWSVLLIFAIHDTEGPLERFYGTFLYLTWNLVTTFIWCFEIGLIVLYRKRESTIIHWLELVVAVYFFQDSVTLMRMIIHMEPDDDVRGEMADVVFSACAYLYQLIDSLYIYAHRNWNYGEASGRESGTFESLSDALMHGAHHPTDENYGSYDAYHEKMEPQTITVQGIV